MRFRKRAKLFPGVYLNFSKSGISTTIGVPGASVNFNKQGTFLNTGIPGTGLYDRTKIGGRKIRNSGIPPNIPATPTEHYDYQENIEIKSNEAEGITTEGLNDLKKTLLDCYQERKELTTKIIKAESRFSTASTLMVLSYIFIIGFFISWFRENKRLRQEDLNELKEQLKNCKVNIDINLPVEIKTKYHQLVEDYKVLLSCERIWDITSKETVNQKISRSAAGNSVNRKPVKFGFSNIDVIQSSFEALHLENANGGDLYIYPAFVAIVDDRKKFGLIEIAELEFHFHGQRFIEEEKIPGDAFIIDYTWAKVNKNGTPDKRFKANYQIPVCKYGNLTFTSPTGLNEVYSLSNYDKAARFAGALEEYQSAIKNNKF